MHKSAVRAEYWAPSTQRNLHTNRFGVIPKGSTGKWRLIVDMSAPEGTSVNNKALGTLKYVGVEDARDEIQRLGSGTLLAKVDVPTGMCQSTRKTGG